VIKNNNVETVVVCTNLAPAALDVGLEVFDETGALRNAVAAGNGAILNVAGRARRRSSSRARACTSRSRRSRCRPP
jgi:hypothetical protein